MARCSFCDSKITPGTGKMYVRKDGRIFNFCNSKCQKNQLKLKRRGDKVEWTDASRKAKNKAKTRK